MNVTDCLFCSIASGKIPADVVHETEALIAFRDINPQAPLHLLIVPKQHITSLDTAKAPHQSLLGDMVLVAADLARTESVAGHGYRTVINTGVDGGQSVDHLHLHLIGGRQMEWPPG